MNPNLVSRNPYTIIIQQKFHVDCKLSYARVLIEVDLLGTLPDLISVQLPNGSTLGQQVIYESLPRFCKNCASMGHFTSSCKKSSSKRPLPKVTETPTSWRQSFPGCKRSKVFLANTIASTSIFGPPPCQGPSSIPPSWQFFNCYSTPMVSQQYMGQPNSGNLPSNSSSNESALTTPI
ncbi:hypothetical protein Peur_050442 [Populus x canadensis]